MKPKGIRLLCIIAVLFAFLYACTKTDSDGSGHGHQAEFVRATLSGRVTDDNKLPVSGATVKAATTSATTDADGFFIIKDIYVDKHATLIKVEKTGYFLGTRTIITDVDQNTPVNIQLIRKMKAGSFSGSGTGNITVPGNGGAIEFTANSIVNPADNKPYAGNVNVSAFFINPAADNFREIMPGTLRGITTGNEETGLQSFGMMAVELNGDNGEKLQIALGQKATLHFPITESLRATAPASITLWSLDETTGLWKEEGTATRVGNEYMGTVSHFSFWNCDVAFPINNFTVTVKTTQGSGLANAEVVITSGTADSISISGNGFTNTDGVLNGTLPANKLLKLKIYDKCRNLLHEKNIGPFNASADLGTITINTQPTIINVSGTVSNCNNAALGNGSVLFELEGLFYNIPVTNGHFSTSIARCNNTPANGKFTAYDMVNNVSGNTISVSVSGSSVNAGQIAACGVALDTYIDYTLNGISYHLAPPADSVVFIGLGSTPASGIVGAFKQKDTSNVDMVLYFVGIQGPGTYPVASVWFMENNFTYSRGNNFLNVTFTEYGTTPGTYIAGSFSGTVADTLSNPNIVVPVTCSFRLLRSIQ
jgi:hypothetical protein